MIIDTHVHYGGESPIYKVYSIEDLFAEAKAAGTDRILQIVTRFKGDNLLSLRQAAEHPNDVIGIIASLDLVATDAVARLEALKEHPGVLGFRMIAGTNGTPKALSDFDLPGLLGTAEKLDYTWDVYAPYESLAIRDVARRYPGVRVLVDHMNVHYYPGRDNRDVFRGWDELIELGKEPNVWIKVSYFPEAVQDIEKYPCPVAMRHLRRLYEEVGAHKLIWASNFPPVLSACTYREALDFIRVHADFLKPDERDAILGGNFLKHFTRGRGVEKQG